MPWRVETLNADVDAELEALEPTLRAKFLHIANLPGQDAIIRNRLIAFTCSVPMDYSTTARSTRPHRAVRTFGPHQVREPYVKPLGNKLWEIRMRGRSGIARAIYVAATGQRVVVLHAFVKQTQKTPRAAIDLALRRSLEVKP